MSTPSQRGSAGFTVMELLIVLVLMSILSTIAVAGYLRMRERGETSAAELNVREGLSAAELYYAHNETYAGMTSAELRALDGGIRLSAEPVIAPDGRHFCLESTHNGNSPSAGASPGTNIHSLVGPGGDIVAGPCPAAL